MFSFLVSFSDRTWSILIEEKVFYAWRISSGHQEAFIFQVGNIGNMNVPSTMNSLKIYLLVASITTRIHAKFLDDLYLQQFTQILEKTAASHDDTLKDECTEDSHCPNNENCFNNRCTDLCPGTCGIDAVCNVLNHTLSCKCFTCYYGDPHFKCKPYTGLRRWRCMLFEL